MKSWIACAALPLLAACPPALTDPLPGTFNQIYNCTNAPITDPPTAPICSDPRETGRIVIRAFNEEDAEEYDAPYELRSDPGGGFWGTAVLADHRLDWTATSDEGYTESGSYTFDDAFATFTGSSSYEADDGSYEGDCTAVGARDPATPKDNPAPIDPCP